jgi:hypothetical protein
LLSLIAVPTKAVPISVVSSFDPQADTVATTIFVEGLGNNTAPSLGAFDIDFQFDSTRLILDAVLFGPLLGSPDNLRYGNTSGTLTPIEFGAGEAITGASLLTGGVNLFEVSLLDVASLDALQPSRVPVLVLFFDGIGEILNVNPDTLGFGLSVNALSDAFGNELVVDSIGFIPVPAPSTLSLLAIGLLGLIWTVRRRPHRRA